jgi:phosphatidylglycerophosphate synthase
VTEHDRSSAPPDGGATTAALTGVLFATARAEHEPASAMPWDGGTLVERLAAQLLDVGVSDLHVIVRPGDEPLATQLGGRLHVSADAAADLRLVAEIARGGAGAMVFAGGEIITQREALAGLLADPRIANGVLATTGKIARPYGHRIKSRRGRIISAGSPFHTTAAPTQTFLGVLKVSPADRPRLARLADHLAALRADPPEAWIYELDTAKAGSWKLAAHRIARNVVERELRQAALEDPEAQAGPEHDFDEPEDPSELERQDPATVDLDAADAAELERRIAAGREDVPALLLTALVRDGAQVGSSYLRSLFWARPLSREAVDRARERIELHDEEAELLRSAVKASDGFFTTFFVSPISKYVARWCAHRGFSPNQITIFSLFVGIVAAACFATGERAGLVVGGVLAYLAFLFDCVDGQTARYTRTFSKLGAWLDSIFDRSKEYILFAGLAIGSEHVGVDVWVLACAALTLQTTRHAIDFAYPTIQHQVIGAVEHAPLEQPGDGLGLNTPLWLRPPPLPKEERPPPEPISIPRRLFRLWRRAGKRRWVVWIKKIITFPIGERFAVIAVVTATTSARTTFVVLLAWGGFAFTYILLGRLLRVARSETAIAPPGTPPGRLATWRDDGPIARALKLTVPIWPAVLLVVAGLPVAVAMVVEGDEASTGLAAAVVAWLVIVGGISAHGPMVDRLRWLVPPLARALEFGTITWLATLDSSQAVPAAFAFLCAVCFREYDLVYRLRHHGTEPPRMVGDLGLGWDGRVLLTLALLAAGLLPAGLYIAAGLLAVLFVGDAVRAWRTLNRAPVSAFDDEEEEPD